MGSHKRQSRLTVHRGKVIALVSSVLFLSSTPAQTPGGEERSLSVFSTPAGAAVFLGETMIGTTPLKTSEIGHGVHRIVVRMDGFSEVVDTLIISRNEHLVRNFRLQRPGGLIVQSLPAGATVYLDEKVVGFTPLTLSDISPGVHRLRITTPEYHDWDQKIVVPESSFVRMEVTMVGKYGTVHLQLWPDDAEVFVDGRKSGFGTGPQKLEVGRHTIEVRHPSSKQPARGSIYVGPGTRFFLRAEVGKTTIVPLLASIPVPGLGQLIDGNHGKGLTIGVGTFVIGGATFFAFNTYNGRRRTYEEARDDYLNERDDEDQIVILRKAMLDRYDELKRLHTLRIFTATLLGALYAYNLFDVITNHMVSHTLETIDEETYFRMKACLQPDGIRVSLSLSF